MKRIANYQPANIAELGSQRMVAHENYRKIGACVRTSPGSTSSRRIAAETASKPPGSGSPLNFPSPYKHARIFRGIHIYTHVSSSLALACHGMHSKKIYGCAASQRSAIAVQRDMHQCTCVLV